MGDLLVVDADFLGQTREQVAAEGAEVLGRVGELADGGADGDLHLLGHTHADNHVVLALHVVDHVVVEDIAGHAYGVVADDTAKRDDGDLGRAASNVDHHVALGLQHIDADTDGGGHRLMDHAYLLGSGLLGALAHGTLLDIGDAGRDAYHHAERRRQERAVDVGHADKLADEVLRHFEVGDDTATQRTHSLDILVVSAAIHALGFLADCDNLVVVAVVGHNRRFVDDHLVVIYHDGVGGAKVHCYLAVEERK